MKKLAILSALAACMALVSCATTAHHESEFVSLFDGESLEGWQLAGSEDHAYSVENGAIVAPARGTANLFTERQYGDFVLRFDFKLSEGGNNGIGIRAPMQPGSIAYEGMEVQVLDDYAPQYAGLRPAQYHGSIYELFAARRGVLKPAGQWNQQEIACIGRRITVRLNGETIVHANLNEVSDPELLMRHPGMLRERGRIGFLGHNSRVEFRDIRIKEIPRPPLFNRPPEGFVSLFNGVDLTGWRGLVGGPPELARLSPVERHVAGEEADRLARRNWRVRGEALIYAGDGFDNLVSARDYGNFELHAEWMITPNGDSGIYLRGTPQVQIWDHPEGSGGLWNNRVHPARPLRKADHYPGTWNRFRILMVGEKVTVLLNDQLVTHAVTLENFWERDNPVYARGPIELQAHRDAVRFRNIYIREIPGQ